ncbi:MAG: DUF4280 domain-containing protein [Paenibacillaceae bacterium]|nr:DUF4280 domain-containing protein [Paenibacillaceae bacterium]
MGWFSWLPGMSEKKEEKPPEPLVLGATLSCKYGSQDSYLDLDTIGLDINGLPEACVEDCVVNKNITPFGKCHVGDMCEYQIAIYGIWQNPEPQKVMKNGKEIITTKSILKCKEAPEPFTIKNSGQDGGHVKDILFIRYVKIEYPSLYEILQDQYGSLYLEGNYKEGIEFLSKRLKANNGEMEIINMYDPNNIEGKFILATLERLLVDCKSNAFVDFMEALEHTANENGMNNLSGWDKNNLNLTMIELIEKDCKKTAERIDNDPVYRASEKHRMFSSWGAESMNTIAYTTVLTASAMAGTNTGKGNTSQESSNQRSTTQKSTTPAKVKDSKSVSTEGAGNVAKFDRNVKVASELDPNTFKGLTDKGTIKVNTSGSNRPLTSTPNSYYKTANGEHIFIYDSEGKLIYDISSSRVKGFELHTNPNTGQEFYKDVKLKGDVPDSIKNIFGW